MHLFSCHCGFYNAEVGSGIYESHINLFVVADSFDEARKKVKELEEFQKFRMHIDGIQQIIRVNGFDIICSSSASKETLIYTRQHRDLAYKPK